MSCGKLSPVKSETITTALAGFSYKAMTPWYVSLGLGPVTAVLKARAAEGTPIWQLAVQYAATRTDKPDAWGVLDQTTSGAGERCTGPESLGNSAKFFTRFGVAVKSSAGGTLAEADITEQVAMNACGSVIGMSEFHAVAVDANTRYEPVTGWVPTSAVATIMAAIVCSGVSGTGLQWRLAYQKAATSTEEPGAWTNLQAGFTAGADEVNTGELTPSYSGEMWVRIGIGYSVSSGSFGEGMISTVVASKP